MPACMVCNASFPDKKGLMLVRDERQRWVMVCTKCREKGRELPTGENKDPGEEGEHQRIELPIVSVSEQEAFARIQHALATLDDDAREEKKVHVRSHERCTANLGVTLLLMRDDRPFKGVVRDISQGGMRLITARSLQKGQVVRLEIIDEKGSPLPGVAEPHMQTAGEVRRVTPLEGGQFEVGIRYIRQSLATEKNRRQHRRHQVSMALFYRRVESDLLLRGDALDVSQGGARVQVDEKMAEGETFTFLLRAIPNAPVRADLQGVARVVRVISQEDDARFEIGCSFVSVQSRPRLPSEA